MATKFKYEIEVLVFCTTWQDRVVNRCSFPDWHKSRCSYETEEEMESDLNKLIEKYGNENVRVLYKGEFKPFTYTRNTDKAPVAPRFRYEGSTDAQILNKCY